ncbi:MAG TPA: response regulator [Candidatus Omnitrophota bacterium]|nr:response regulator [Candidatus Omnitrophota bacterium]
MDTELKRTLQVLIVENNDVDRAVLINMLSKAPYGSFQISATDSLQETFELLKQSLVDVVLLDLNIKDSNGIDTLKRLHGRYPQLAVVVNTGEYQDDLGLRAVTMGAQDYLIKGMYKSYGLVKALYYAIERKKAETELHKAMDELKEMQAQLIRAEKMNVVGGVASGIAHEVKNPLATILYGVEYLNTVLKDGDDKIELTLRSIKDAAYKANSIIKDLLDFASLSDIKRDLCPIERTIEQGLVLTHHQCEKFQIKIVKHFATNLPNVLIDKNRIEQVVVDLILNAIAVMKNGGTLTIRTTRKIFDRSDISVASNLTDSIAVGEDVLIVDFEDTGKGIPDEYLEKIFDPFFTTHRAAGGVGLGLSIARTIMDSHGGMIDLANKEDKQGARARLVFKVNGK